MKATSTFQAILKHNIIRWNNPIFLLIFIEKCKYTTVYIARCRKLYWNTVSNRAIVQKGRENFAN